MNVERRTFIALAGALAASPTAFAQARVWRIGSIGGIARPPSLEDSIYGGLIQGLRDLGYVEGRNLAFEWRFAAGKFDLFPEFAREFVGLKVDLIFSGSTPATRAAQQVTKTVPIVFGASGDPVAAGPVQSLARPGGNVTGLSQNLSDLAPKSFELLKTLLPKLSRFAVLYNSGNQSNLPIVKSFQSAGPVLGVDVLTVEVSGAAQHQPENREGARCHYSAYGRDARRPGDRVSLRPRSAPRPKRRAGAQALRRLPGLSWKGGKPRGLERGERLPRSAELSRWAAEDRNPKRA